jgi:hypothetical protein
MAKFDFISVLVSIVFGLGLTHLCAGAFQLAYRRQLGELSLLFAGWILIVIVLNWWVFFRWHTRAEWTLEILLALVSWALSFYAMAYALFPMGIDTGAQNTGIQPDTRYRGFSIALISTLVLDVIVTALLGTLFEPWYYLPFVAQYVVCAVVIHRTTHRPVRRAIAWWMIVSILAWCLLVRRSLS